MTAAFNLFANLPDQLPQELFTVLLAGKHVRIERIVSQGHASPAGYWYDQDQHEWVLLLKGAARLRFEDETIELQPGDFVNIAAHRKHRVEWTTPDEPTIWLAVHDIEEPLIDSLLGAEIEKQMPVFGACAMPTDDLNAAESIVLHTGPTLARLTDDDFFEFCQLNRDLRIECTRDGDWIIMPPTGGETGWRSASVTAQLVVWSQSDQTGLVFDSSTGFRLPNGAKRSPDCAWISRARWKKLSAEERTKLPPLAPDFVVELRSTSDPLAVLMAKMDEYRENGVRLGWLIDPTTRKAWIYRPGVETEELNSPAALDASPVLPGFVLKLDAIWC